MVERAVLGISKEKTQHRYKQIYSLLKFSTFLITLTFRSSVILPSLWRFSSHSSNLLSTVTALFPPTDSRKRCLVRENADIVQSNNPIKVIKNGNEKIK